MSAVTKELANRMTQLPSEVLVDLHRLLRAGLDPITVELIVSAFEKSPPLVHMPSGEPFWYGCDSWHSEIDDALFAGDLVAQHRCVEALRAALGRGIDQAEAAKMVALLFG